MHLTVQAGHMGQAGRGLAEKVEMEEVRLRTLRGRPRRRKSNFRADVDCCLCTAPEKARDTGRQYARVGCTCRKLVVTPIRRDSVQVIDAAVVVAIVADIVVAVATAVADGWTWVIG